MSESATKRMAENLEKEGRHFDLYYRSYDKEISPDLAFNEIEVLAYQVHAPPGQVDMGYEVGEIDEVVKTYRIAVDLANPVKSIIDGFKEMTTEWFKSGELILQE